MPGSTPEKKRACLTLLQGSDAASLAASDGSDQHRGTEAMPEQTSPASSPIAAPTANPISRGRALGIAASLLVHAGLFALVALAAQDVEERRPREKAYIELDIVQAKPLPLPKPVAAPAPELAPPTPSPALPPPSPKPKPKPKPVIKPKPTPKAEPKPIPAQLPPLPPEAKSPPADQEPSAAPPPPNEAPPQSAKPSAPVRIGISMSSTSAAGSFSAPVGNTLYGAAPKVATDPRSVQPYASADGRYAAPKGGRYVPPARVTALPKVSREVQAVYPEAARRAGIEGQVVLRLRIGDRGQVLEARVLEAAGHGFDEAALAAVNQFSFQPGTVDGAPVATDITYTYTFLLD